MNGGVKAALLVSCLGLAACVTTTKEVKVRAIPDPAAALSQGGDEIAAARGELVLGNVGLALEGFRKAQRNYPTNAAPLQGIGDCYASMGRFYLAQTNYEAALALTPQDRRLLLGLAAIYEREGDLMRAAHARADADRTMQPPPAIAMAVAAPASPAPLQPQAPQEQDLGLHAVTGSITVELPPARPAEHLETASAASSLQPMQDFADVSRSVTVPLPPARPSPQAASAPVPLPPPAPARDPVRPESLVATVDVSAPRLERLTSGEVALVTSGKPIWRAPSGTRMAAGGGVHWVALAPAVGKPNVQVLNAAHSQGIAASARSVLVNRGWRRIAIGNAPAVQQTSVVLYSRKRAKLGRSLAAQFGVEARMVERDVLVLVIGRDGVGRVASQQRS